MAQVQCNIIVRRKGTIVTDTTAASKRKPVRVKRPAWRTTSILTKTEQRLSTDCPDRNDLTTAQYREWSEGLRTLRHYGVPQAEMLSLNDQRETLFTIRYNEMYHSAMSLA